jgi:phytoene dehydrogenase-like protein
MTREVIVIGAGMGGLAASVRLAQRGFRVRVFEARRDAGGLAGRFEKDGFAFDAGPYILLDRYGLEWAFGSIGVDLSGQLALHRIQHVYQVSFENEPPIEIFDSLDQTAAGIDQNYPGSGRRYIEFVRSMTRKQASLRPLLQQSNPGPVDLLRTGSWIHIPFLLRSLNGVLKRTRLPRQVVDALAIWTHIAGQHIDEAPSPMAFVPALIHSDGAYYPEGGMGAIPNLLKSAAIKAGVEINFGRRVTGIRCRNNQVEGVEIEGREFVEARAVISNHSGVGTYIDLLAEIPASNRQQLKSLPLQSPGVCAYLALKGKHKPPYLRLKLPGRGDLCRLLVTPSVLAPEIERDGWWPGRLISPMRHDDSQRLGREGQQMYLERILAETWWRDEIEDCRILATRAPADWGAQFNLYHDSMNPVMTARFMREGRLAHRSPYIQGLYLAGSSTHPGQWVSFCAISGILAADCLCEDLT